MLKKHWPNVPIFNDVTKLKASDIGECDVICGGFPCQDISEAGKRAGITGEKSGLWKEYARLIGEVRPKWAVVENVRALRGRGLDAVLRDLAQSGYDAEWYCLPASFAGSPQHRERIWIVAYPNSCNARQSQPGNSSHCVSQARQNEASQIGRRLSLRGKQDWLPEPAICRVVNGISANVHRVSMLGNAVVPQIAEIIGKAIIEFEQGMNAAN